MPNYKQDVPITNNHLRQSNIFTDIFITKKLGKNIAKQYGLSEGRISQIKADLIKLKYPPKIKDNKVVCFKCFSDVWLGIHHNHEKGDPIAILCQSCNLRVGNNELAFKYGPEEWKEGFKELYSFFEAVMKQSKRIIKNKEIWNGLLKQRNIDLIDKLGDEIL